MENAASIDWRASLVTRLALLGALLLAGIVGVFGFLTYRGNSEHLIATTRQSLEHDAQIVSVKLQSAVGAVTRDIVYLSRIAAVGEFARSSGAEHARWKQLVEQDFRALLAGKPSYFQVRLIGLADGGRELVRVDNDGGKIEVMAADRLQQKADRDYFQAGLKLRPGEVHLSEINLNQDFGKISEPHIPTLRAVTPLAGPDGVFALAVINVDLRELFAELQALVGGRAQLLLANRRGDYLVHPDAARTFASDLGTGFNFLRDYPGALRAAEPAWLRTMADSELILAVRRPLTGDTEREVFVAVALPASELLGGLRATRDNALRATGLVALAAIALLVLAARPTVRRLHRVTDAIARYDAGGPVEAIPTSGSDEISVLAQKFAGMAEKVRAQVRSLDAARHEAEEATRAKEQFLAVMSHEIRTPMNAVIGLLRVLDRNKPAPHQEPVLRSLRIAARNLLSLLNDALDFTRLKAGKIEFERADFSLVETLTDLALTHRPVALQKGLSLDLEIAPDLPPAVQGDAVRLMQILNNLVSNALKFTERGGIRIEAAPTAEGRVCFTVEDTGIGIARENFERVFTPFEQVDARKFDGAGLGLCISRALVERQGGMLELRSAPGEGSRFTVTLPFAPAEHVTPTHESEERPPRFPGRKVLYVEDVASNREVLAATLEGTGVALTMVETGAEALARLRAEPFDLALLDLQLPDTTGPELARAIRAAGLLLPMIAVTAQTSAASAEECRSAGMSGVVSKPIEPRRLFEEMARCLGTPISFAKLEEIFADPRPMLATLAREFRAHRRDLEQAFAADDFGAIARIRHKTHSAIELLGLEELRDTFSKVEARENGARARCLELIEQTARALATPPAAGEAARPGATG